MKKKNQTISLRDLVKKMKRHSTRTIVLTATVMAILCGGLIYAFFPIQDVEAQEKETLNMQQPQSEMQKQLRDILNYLQEQNVSFGRVYSELPTLNDVFLEITGKELRD